MLTLASTSVRRLNGAVARQPLASAILFGTSSKLTVDLIVQRAEHQQKLRHQQQERHQQQQPQWVYDVRRGAAFAIFGLVYLGIAQHQIYARAFPWALSKMAIESRAHRALAQVPPGALQL